MFDEVAYNEAIRRFRYEDHAAGPHFIADCLRAFPGWAKLHRALKENSNKVGELLNDLSDKHPDKAAARELYRRWTAIWPNRYNFNLEKKSRSATTATPLQEPPASRNANAA